MTRRRDRLDAYVRQVIQLDDDRTAAPVDLTARQELFERITRMDVDHQPELRHPSPRRPVRMVAVAACVVVLAVAGLVSTGVVDGRDQQPPTAAGPALTGTPTPSPERQGDAFGPGVQTSCVEAYGARTLGRRTFAFDGTVVSIAGQPATNDATDPYVPVTFAVTRWFRGGHGDRVTVAMVPPDARTSADRAGYTIGSRLLVSGTDRWGDARLTSPVAWPCGFTRWYNQTDAQVWAQAFR